MKFQYVSYITHIPNTSIEDVRGPLKFKFEVYRGKINTKIENGRKSKDETNHSVSRILTQQCEPVVFKAGRFLRSVIDPFPRPNHYETLREDTDTFQNGDFVLETLNTMIKTELSLIASRTIIITKRVQHWLSRVAFNTRRGFMNRHRNG